MAEARENGVLVGGAINTDLVARVRRAPESGETVTGSDFQIFGGGKGANQALAAARSGAPTSMLGGLGQDDFGRQRRADLEADGIATAGIVAASDRASGVALITVEETGQNRIAYVPGATLAVRPEDATRCFWDSGATLVLTTLELPMDTLLSLYSAAIQARARIVLNATPEPELGRELMTRADVLIVNEPESLALLGIAHASGDRDWWNVAETLRGRGARDVIITLGAQGAIASTERGRFSATPPPVTVVDTTGAGDAFCGALCARLGRGELLGAALAAGVAAGTLACTMEGAQRSMPRRVDVDALAARIEVRQEGR